MKVLVPTQFGPSTARALALAIGLAQDGLEQASEVCLLSVIPEPSLGIFSTVAGDKTLEEMIADAEQKLTELKATLPEGLRSRSKVLVASDVAEAIVDFAAAERSDVVVIGRVPRSWWRGWLSTTTAEEIEDRALCRVIVVDVEYDPKSGEVEALPPAEPSESD